MNDIKFVGTYKKEDVYGVTSNQMGDGPYPLNGYVNILIHISFSLSLSLNLQRELSQSQSKQQISMLLDHLERESDGKTIADMLRIPAGRVSYNLHC